MKFYDYADALETSKQLDLARCVDRARLATLASESDLIILQQAALSGFSAAAVAREAHDRFLHRVQPVARSNYVLEGAIREAKDLTKYFQSAVESARLAGSLGLYDSLEQYRLPDLALASQLAAAYKTPWWHDYQLHALNTHSALSGMLAQIPCVEREAVLAVESVLSGSFAGIESIRQAKQFLELSGLLKFPRFRLLTRVEKRRQVRMLVRGNMPALHVKKAHSLNHRYEIVLRVVIAHRMELAYGDNWAQERLPKCASKKLLGKILEEGECVLDHADFFHYEAIMCHAEHFSAAFSDGYEDVEDLRRMLTRLGALRAKCSHARTFSAENLREMTILWKTIESGFDVLVNDIVIEQI